MAWKLPMNDENGQVTKQYFLLEHVVSLERGEHSVLSSSVHNFNLILLSVRLFLGCKVQMKGNMVVGSMI